MLRIANTTTLIMLAFTLLPALAAKAQAGQPGGASGSPDTVSHRLIVVSLEDRKLALMDNGELRKVYTVAVGKPATPSPVGNFIIERRVANPTYSHNGQVVAPGAANPVGTRWMGLSAHGYGIHGTNAPKSIGKAASHGCIRMNQPDLEELFALVRAGDAVEIVGHRNEQNAQIFTAQPGDTMSIQTAQTTQPEPTVAGAVAGNSIESQSTMPSAQ